MTTWVVVVAAGRATRFGALKQFERLAGRPVVDWSTAAARQAADGVVLVVPPGAGAGDGVDGAPPTQVDVVVEGAATRSGSVRAGLAAVPGEATVIVVHDAARPLARVEHFHAVVAAVRAGADGAVCAVPVSDTIKRVAHGAVVVTVDRADLWAVQTPQAFRAEVLRRAHHCGADATDDAALVEAAGGRVVVVAGDPRNIKLTDRTDLAVAEALLTTLRP
ncbi:MAG: 2-C-methyl-D-erythritol 4-phosphate cytidylyltransferase [Acidimicrobiales bacterium]